MLFGTFPDQQRLISQFDGHQHRMINDDLTELKIEYTEHNVEGPLVRRTQLL